MKNGCRAVEEKYRALEPMYLRLGENLARTLELCLEAEGVNYLQIDQRIKSFSSFCDKVHRKGYSDPFGQTEDICGLRIICYYPSDVQRIGEIISAELEVKNEIHKPLPVEPDRFGYRSLHFVVTPQDSWLKEPTYRGLARLKAEIQVRTLLMHAWAEIEHKLAYKKQEYIPPLFRRKFSQLSALLELSDEHFELLRQERGNYQKGGLGQQSAGLISLRRNPLSMSLDSLQEFLDDLLPNRERSEAETEGLLGELLGFGITLDVIKDSCEKTRSVIAEVEKEIFQYEDYEDNWAQVGFIRAVLELTNDDYWEERRRYISSRTADVIHKFRAKLKNTHA